MLLFVDDEEERVSVVSVEGSIVATHSEKDFMINVRMYHVANPGPSQK